MSSVNIIDKCNCTTCDKSKDNFYYSLINFCAGIALLSFISGIIIIDKISLIVGWIFISCGFIVSIIASGIYEYYDRNYIKSESINLTPILKYIELFFK